MEQKLQTLNQQNKLMSWPERISACRESGQNVKTWCKDHNICEATFYKWQKKLFEMVNYQQTCFAEVTPVNDTLIVDHGDADIFLDLNAVVAYNT